MYNVKCEWNTDSIKEVGLCSLLHEEVVHVRVLHKQMGVVQGRPVQLYHAKHRGWI